MGKHLPPPKNKHLRQAEAKKTGPAVIQKIRQEKLVCRYGCGAKDVAITAAALALLIAACFMPVAWPLKAAVFLPACLLGGFEIIKNAFIKAVGGDYIQEDLLIILAAAGAMCIGDCAGAGALIILYRAGRLLEAYSIEKSREARAGMKDLRAVKARLLTDEGPISVRPWDLRPGDVIFVAPGERIPLDGVIIEGVTTLDMSPLTGETKTTAAAPGSRVVSGGFNITSPVKIRVSADFDDSTAARIMELLENPGGYKSGQESLAARFSGYFTPAAALAAVLTAVIPPLFGGEWLPWLRRALVLLAISGAGSLAVSVPLAYFGGVRNAAGNGVLIKGHNDLESLTKSRTMIFCKTGIITEGQYSIVDVFPEPGVSEQKLLKIAAAAERNSRHPIARLLRAEAGAPGDEGEFRAEELPGKGVSAYLGKSHVYVGNAVLLEERGIRYAVPGRPGIAIHVAVDDRYWGHIIVADKIKDGAFDTLETLRHHGVSNMVMLTGDVLAVSKPVASSLDFDMVKAGLLPEAKVAATEYLLATKADEAVLSFVGDGELDAMALNRADLGIAVGALGSDEALENAGIIIMSDDIRKLALTMKISARTVGVARNNIYLVLSAKLLIASLALCGLMPLTAAAIADTAAWALALFNALRTLQFESRSSKEEEAPQKGKRRKNNE